MLLIAPAIILICSLLVYPVLYGVWLSLFKKHSFFPDQRFVGIANYIYLMKDSGFWMSVWYGTVYSVSTIVLQIVFGIIAALIVNEAFRGRNFVRGVILFPYVIPTVVAIILEVASQQPIRIGELYDALPWHRRRSGILDGQRSHYDVFDYHQRVGVFPICGLECSCPHANHSTNII